MKKIISLCVILFIMTILVGCKEKVIYYEDFESYETMDEIIETWKSDWENKKYYFLDVRIESDRKKACIPYFNYAGSKSQANDILKNSKKNTPIIIMGKNKEDSKPEEMRKYLEEKGFTNVSIYLGGFENYLEKEGFIPNTNCSIDCGCN